MKREIPSGWAPWARFEGSYFRDNGNNIIFFIKYGDHWNFKLLGELPGSKEHREFQVTQERNFRSEAEGWRHVRNVMLLINRRLKSTDRYR